jgi:hypothetical protein
MHVRFKTLLPLYSATRVAQPLMGHAPRDRHQIQTPIASHGPAGFVHKKQRRSSHAEREEPLPDVLDCSGTLLGRPVHQTTLEGGPDSADPDFCPLLDLPRSSEMAFNIRESVSCGRNSRPLRQGPASRREHQESPKSHISFPQECSKNRRVIAGGFIPTVKATLWHSGCGARLFLPFVF